MHEKDNAQIGWDGYFWIMEKSGLNSLSVIDTSYPVGFGFSNGAALVHKIAMNLISWSPSLHNFLLNQNKKDDVIEKSIHIPQVISSRLKPLLLFMVYT